MKALSVRQPWAWLIVNGHKDIENRVWNTRFRGRIWIHAGLRHDGPRDSWDWRNIQPPKRFEYGGIIGSVEIVDVVTRSRSRWFSGPFGFVLRNPRRARFRACSGRLMFFEPDFDVSPRAGGP